MDQVVRCNHCDRPLVVRAGLCALCGETPAVERLMDAPHAFSSGAARDLASKLRLAEIQRAVERGESPEWPPSGSARTRRTRWPRRRPKHLHDPSSWQEAEQLACAWMRKNGYGDAHVTPPGADNGIDVVARKGVAQVKFHAKPIGVAEIQRISGIAFALKKKPLFFSRCGYTPAALAWARQHGLELYAYPPVRRVR